MWLIREWQHHTSTATLSTILKLQSVFKAVLQQHLEYNMQERSALRVLQSISVCVCVCVKERGGRDRKNEWTNEWMNEKVSVRYQITIFVCGAVELDDKWGTKNVSMTECRPQSSQSVHGHLLFNYTHKSSFSYKPQIPMNLCRLLTIYTLILHGHFIHSADAFSKWWT